MSIRPLIIMKFSFICCARSSGISSGTHLSSYCDEVLLQPSLEAVGGRAMHTILDLLVNALPITSRMQGNVLNLHTGWYDALPGWVLILSVPSVMEMPLLLS